MLLLRHFLGAEAALVDLVGLVYTAPLGRGSNCRRAEDAGLQEYGCNPKASVRDKADERYVLGGGVPRGIFSVSSR